MLTRKLFDTSNWFGGRLALVKTQQAEEGYTSATTGYQDMLHKNGVAKTILRPAGKVDIEGDMYDATALTGYIEKDEQIIVVGYQTGQLVVKKKENT